MRDSMAKGKLTFIGLGLYDENDISIKGVNEIKNADKIFAEFYTSKLSGTTINKIEETIYKKIQLLTRKQTESAKLLLDSAKTHHVVFLVAGDPMTATTHVDLRIRAIENNIPTQIIHGSSIVTAAPGLVGLQNYKFGRTTTLAIPEENYFPTSPYDVIQENNKMGLHTLVLLDIQADKDTYMTANQAIDLLLKMEEKQKQNLFTKNTIICVIGQAGSLHPTIHADKISTLKNLDFGPPLHCLIIPGKLHFMEIEALIKIAHLPIEDSKKLQKV